MKVFGTLSENFVDHLMTFFLVVGIIGVITAIAMGFACCAIVRGKGYPDNMNYGFIWGFFLGFIGLIVCLCKPVYYPPNNMYGGPGGPYYNGQPYGGQHYGGQPYYGRPFGPQPGSQDWYCSCGAANPPDTRICLYCGNTRRS